MRQITVSSVSEYISQVLDLRRQLKQESEDSNNFEIWFRGQKNHNWGLIPGLYRSHYQYAHPIIESSQLLTFKQEAPATLQRNPISNWEWYFLMQHYGLPTRLLDWSKNPMVGLYFALDGYEYHEIGSLPILPTVWVLDPLKLNQHLYDVRRMPSVVVVADENELDMLWSPSGFRRSFDNESGIVTAQTQKGITNHSPIAIHPPRWDRRILAQSGTFTVHGTDTAPLDEYHFGLEPLEVKITIDIARPAREELFARAADDILRDLKALGLTSSRLFPELQFIATEIAAEHNKFKI